MNRSAEIATKEPELLRGILERVDELLEVTYRSADLGNVEDPLAETVYILLAKQTREGVYRPIFRLLRKRFPTWNAVLAATNSDVETILRPGGFQRQRAVQLKALLTAVREDNIRRGFHKTRPKADLTLSYLHDMSDQDVARFLQSLPGIGPKSARCVMVYALDRSKFAVDTHVHRIFTRLKLRESRGRKNDHDSFEAIVPDDMRKRLHVNLVHHGRTVCRSQAPRCGSCVLVSFCQAGQKEVARTPDNRPTTVDLFSGAGGMGCGFTQAGFRTVLAVELERHAAQTYRTNHPGVPVVETDVTKLNGDSIRKLAPGMRSIDVILAGPPCQGYSAAGLRRPEDPRNQMFRHVSRLASDLLAKVVVFENVPGLRRVNGTGFLDNILASLRARGFSAAAHLLTASSFGVPQNRRRYFIIGSRRDDGLTVVAPEPTHRIRGEQENAKLPFTPSVAQLLEDLPAFGSGVDAEYLPVDNGQVLLNASTMSHSPRVIAKIKSIGPGDGPISYRRLEADVARTLVAGHRALPVHPTLHRAISVREAARIQGFPDSYVFCGPRAEQPLQVANAVTPPVAHAIGLRILGALEGVELPLDRNHKAGQNRIRKSS